MSTENTQNNRPKVAIEQDGKAGRPTKYEPKTTEHLCTGLSDGLPIKSACIVASISVSTLADWRGKYPELEERIAKAREAAPHKMLQLINRAGDDDWRAAAESLRLTFPNDYRKPSNTSVEVNTAIQAAVVCSEERRQELVNSGSLKEFGCCNG